ncbi:MAG: hypothetical protein A4E72_01041 [Syntrophus sp. PtaU1.Bin208]|nr:MAG: hypothetical protein A4E72_01041 [Syntrophus sp. PtaU1.Bin208]
MPLHGGLIQPPKVERPSVTVLRDLTMPWEVSVCGCTTRITPTVGLSFLEKSPASHFSIPYPTCIRVIGVLMASSPHPSDLLAEEKEFFLGVDERGEKLWFPDSPCSCCPAGKKRPYAGRREQETASELKVALRTRGRQYAPSGSSKGGIYCGVSHCHEDKGHSKHP